MDLKKIQNRLRNFAIDRYWEQFHNPKILTIAFIRTMFVRVQ